MTRALPFTEHSLARAIRGVEKAGRFVIGVRGPKGPSKSPGNPEDCRTLDRREVARRLYQRAAQHIEPSLVQLLERAAELIQDDDTRITFRTHTSFPFLRIARQFSVPYADVLNHAENIYSAVNRPETLPFEIGTRIDLTIEAAVFVETERRAAVGGADA